MQNNYRLEERAPQAGSSGGTQKSAERHPSLFSTDAPLLLLGYSSLPRIVRDMHGRHLSEHGPTCAKDRPLSTNSGNRRPLRLQTGSHAKTAMDEKNLPKQLAEFFADRHENEFRFIPGLGRWVFWNGERWCLDYFGHYLAAAQRLCREAAERMWNPNIDTAAMVSTLLRLASFSPKMTAPIDGEMQPYLKGLLAGKGMRQ
jgi:hypothetical protein